MKKLIVLLLVASSCAPMYIPNSRNSPMFTKGGEFQGSFSMGNGLEGQAAVSITNHIGLIGNYSYINREDLDSDSEEVLRHKVYEGGVGYFYNDQKTFFEIFAGYGRGEGNSYDKYSFFGSTRMQAKGKYERYFIQPAIGVNKKTFHFAFVPRVSFVDFTEFSGSGATFEVDSSPYVFFEPAFIGRVNTMENRLFFTFQAGFSTPIDREPFFDHRGAHTSVGLGFRIGGLKSEPVELKQR
jgi:hypothetical protein